MKIPNVNCKHKDGFGKCKKKPKFLGIFLRDCEEAVSVGASGVCDIADRFPKPKAPPPPPTPTPSRIISEGVFPSKITRKRWYKRIL